METTSSRGDIRSGVKMSRVGVVVMWQVGGGGWGTDIFEKEYLF